MPAAKPHSLCLLLVAALLVGMTAGAPVASSRTEVTAAKKPKKKKCLKGQVLNKKHKCVCKRGYKLNKKKKKCVKVPAVHPTSPTGTTTSPTATDEPSPRGAESSTEGDDSGTAPVPVPETPPPPGPRKVVVQTDPAISDTQAVGHGGGTLSVTRGAVTYKLAIPSGALQETHTIKMSPVVALSGFDLTGAPVAIQLEPDGLYLDAPAMLEISTTAPDGLPADLTTFAWHGSGEEFHLYPLFRDGAFTRNRLTFEVWHFSGYGGGPSSDSTRAEQQDHVPTSPGDDREQKLEEAAREARECDIAGGSDCSERLAAEMRANLLASYPGILAALNGANTDKDAQVAIGEAFSWMRTAQLFDLSGLDSQVDALTAAIGGAISRAYDRAWANCKARATAQDGLDRLFRHLRTAQLMDLQLDESRLERCIAWKVSFKSTFDTTFDGPFESGSQKETFELKDLKILYHVDHFVGIGHADTKHTLVRSTSDGQGAQQTGTGTVDVLAIVRGATPADPVETLTLRLPSHGLTGTYTRRFGNENDGFQTETGPLGANVPWLTVFDQFHGDLMFASESDPTRSDPGATLLWHDLPLDDEQWSFDAPHLDADGKVLSTEKSEATVEWAGGL